MQPSPHCNLAGCSREILFWGQFIDGERRSDEYSALSNGTANVHN